MPSTQSNRKGKRKYKYNNKNTKAMKTLNNNTKKAQAFINAYNRSKIFDLYEAYASPSPAKCRANYSCRMMMQSEGGHGYKIIGYNCNYFTVAWIAGNSLRVETFANSFEIPEAVK